MSDAIKHECGIALIRLLKPLEYYIEKYGSATYGINKMYLLMEKQHNRGQDGAGLANIKFDVEPGQRYISRYRSNTTHAIKDIFEKVHNKFQTAYDKNPDKVKDAKWLKENIAFTGELYLGHLRYGTYGGNSIEQCHPFLRQNNWMTRNLVVAGNFNLTNVDELFNLLVSIGQHPKEKSDTVTVLEKIGHFLDVENQQIFDKYKEQGLSNQEISKKIAEELNVQKILEHSSSEWDGGYVMSGLFGHGDAFVLRDPSGIRPAFYYQDEEVVVVTSERPVIQTAFNVPLETIKEIQPGHALIIKKNGKVTEELVKTPTLKTPCSFERIYFSRGSDKDIYKERKQLGRNICDLVLKAVDNDLKNSVFSFIPNTAEVSFYGLMKGLQDALNVIKLEKIKALGPNPSDEDLKQILALRNRIEKIAIKDAKLRTFITQDNSRDDLVAHVYDITYGSVYPTDNLVIIDDSIVRGTTLKQSILKILDRLNPKKIVVVSSAPQIRYPDCYGIDMTKFSDFIAFKAAIQLLKDTNQEHIIQDTYNQCKAQENLPKEQLVNHVKNIYKPFTAEQISEKIAEMLTPNHLKAKVEIVFQTIEGLHDACPNHKGDWYFTGNYPTPGGNKVVNNSFINYFEGKNQRSY
ncbi:MAG: amidophosphoribosyltransferase [Flavobacteriales bacterium]|nr:amidophosphoribosyltransferase [Flavobacteriales bacterium]